MASFDHVAALGPTEHPQGHRPPDAAGLTQCYGPGYRRARQVGDESRWISNTALLQHDHPRLRIQALRLTQLRNGEREKALACYHFVRSINFSLTADPLNTSSLDVLSANSGDWHSKSTLLTALLRCLAIPARVRVVQTSAFHMFGILNCDGKPIDHAFTEVLLGGEWQGIDSYVVDLPLCTLSRARLLAEKRKAGYGVHMEGQVSWNTLESSFAHLGNRYPKSLPIRDYGHFDDVQQFRRAIGPGIGPGWARRRQAVVVTALANQRIRRLRSEQWPPIS